MKERATGVIAASPSEPATRSRLILVGNPGLMRELRARLPDYWQLVLVTESAVDARDVQGFTVVVGDGTSALVLARAGAERARAVLAALPDDEANREVLRLAKERFAVGQVLALVDTAAHGESLRESDIEVVSRDTAVATVLRNRLERSSVVAESVGLGEGELLQITIHPSSLAIGRALRSFSPRDWTVAAVFRRGRLVIPHGDTVLEAHDRLLLIGQPHVLPAVGEYLRVGRTRFPLPYGVDMAVIAVGSHVPEALTEAARVANAADLGSLPMYFCGSGTHALPVVPELAVPDVHWSARNEPPATTLATVMDSRDVGCVCLLPPERKQGSGQPRRNALLDEALRRSQLPVYLPSGRPWHERVLVPIAVEMGTPQALEVACDISVLVGAPLHVLFIDQPGWLSADVRPSKQSAWVQEIADARRVAVSVSVAEGNPLRQTVLAATTRDVVVLGAKPSSRTALFRPNPLRYLLSRLDSSVIVVPAAAS